MNVENRWFRWGFRPAVAIRALGGVVLLTVVCCAVSSQAVALIPPDKRQTFTFSHDFLQLGGQRATVQPTAGKVMLLNLWATWCPPCVREMPSLNMMYKKLAIEGLEMYAVSNEPFATLFRFNKDKSYSFPILSDPDTYLARLLGAEVIPTSVIIDKHGRIALRVDGGADWDSPQMLEAIRSVLKES